VGRVTSVVVCQANLTAADVESMNDLLAREASLCYRHGPGATNPFRGEIFNPEDRPGPAVSCG